MSSQRAQCASETSGPRRPCLLWPALAGGLVLAGCQSYEPRPLDPAAHRAAWHGRTLEGSSLEEFLGRLDVHAGAKAAGFDPADGLNLREARLVALVFNPELRLARLRVGRAAASAEHAGLWADPRLSLDVLYVTESVSDRWVITPGLAFTLPTSGGLQAEQKVADAEQRTAELAAREAEWSVWFEVERTWIEWSATRVRVEETERLVGAMDALVQTATQLADRGEVARTEAALFTVEQAQRRNQLRRMRGEVAASEQELRALMGLSPEAPVELVPALAVSSARTDPDTSRLAERNPSLARLAEEYEVSEQALNREIRKQYPDLTLGPLYEADQGQSRIGFLGGLPLPFLNANRRGIAEARVEREIARAAFETRYETTVGRLAAVGARADSLADQREDMEEFLVPLVDGQLADSVALMRLGEGTSLVLLESLTRAYQTKLDFIDTRSAEALARAEIAYLVGPEVNP